MEHGNLYHGIRRKQVVNIDERRQHTNRDENNRTDDIVYTVDHGCTLGIVLRTNRRQERRDGRANVDAANQKCREMHRHQSLHGQCLQYADSCGRALNDTAQNQTDNKSQQRIGRAGDKVLKFGNVLETGHRVTHRMQTLEQNTKTKNDLSHIPLYFFLADKDTYRSEPRNVQRNQNTRHGRADVCAENNASRLKQVHNARIQEAHTHDCRCRRGLHAGGDENAQKEAHNRVACQFLQQVVQLWTGSQFQSGTHVLHAEQKQSQSAAQG